MWCSSLLYIGNNLGPDFGGLPFILLHVAKLQQNDGNEPSQCCCFSLPVTVSVVLRLQHYLCTAHLQLPTLQSRFRPLHSTETALLCVLSDILAAVDRGDFAAPVLLDLSAAFNTVDHDILLQRLQTSFGIGDAALNWFCQFNLTYVTRGRGLVCFCVLWSPHIFVFVSLTYGRSLSRAYKTSLLSL